MHHTIIKKDSGKINPFIAKQNTDKRNQIPGNMDINVRIGHIHQQNIQSNNDEQGRIIGLRP